MLADVTTSSIAASLATPALPVYSPRSALRSIGRIVIGNNTCNLAPMRIWRVIAASTAGTMIEWYDFFIFGSLATILASQFYPPGNPTTNFLKTLATFGVGFAVRPLGALFFGRL